MLPVIAKKIRKAPIVFIFSHQNILTIARNDKQVSDIEKVGVYEQL